MSKDILLEVKQLIARGDQSKAVSILPVVDKQNPDIKTALTGLINRLETLRKRGDISKVGYFDVYHKINVRLLEYAKSL